MVKWHGEMACAQYSERRGINNCRDFLTKLFLIMLVLLESLGLLALSKRDFGALELLVNICFWQILEL